MKYTLYKLILPLVVVVTATSSIFGMQNEESQLTSYNSFYGTPINKDTIAQLAQEYGLPEEKAAVVRKWRDENKVLIKEMTEFYYPNSEWLNHVRQTKAQLAEQGIDYVGKGDAQLDWTSYMFPLPVNENLHFYATTPLYRIENLKRYHGHDWDFARNATGRHDPEKLNTLEKSPTYQTVSEFSNGLLFRQAAEKNNFNNFSAPATYLFPVDDDQTGYSDDKTFVLQERSKASTNKLFDEKNPQRLQELLKKNHPAFYELMVATHAIGMWDMPKILVDEENKLHNKSLRQPDNSNPEFFPNENVESGSYCSYSSNTRNGFNAMYTFCKNNNIQEGQRMIQQFVRDNVHLPSEYHQNELEKNLELNK
jgi:hypothetical protein